MRNEWNMEALEWMELRERKKLKTLIEYNRMIKSESVIEIRKIEQDNIIKLKDVYEMTMDLQFLGRAWEDFEFFLLVFFERAEGPREKTQKNEKCSKAPKT